MNEELVDDRVNELKQELAQEFSPLVPESTLEECLRDVWTAYKDARIRDYVPLLVRRETRTLLLQRATAGVHP